jgi:hypothetical protein
MATEDGPERRRRSTETISADAMGEEEPEATDVHESDDEEPATPLGSDRELASTLTAEGESLVDVLNYLNDPESHPGETDGLELQFDRDAGESQQNHVHGVFQHIHQICKMADDSISISAIELTPEGDDQ